MKRSFLLPHWCKVTGTVLFALVILWYVFLIVYVGDSHEKWGEIAAKTPKVLHGIDVILLAISMLMIAFSREKDEDEYVAAVRGKYLVLAFYIDCVVLIIATLAVTAYDIRYFATVAVSQMFLILFLHIVMFNIAMAVIRSRNRKEARS